MSGADVMSCRLDLTHRARNEMSKWAKDEHVLLSVQEHFDVHIERLPEKEDQLSFSFYFDNQTNVPLSSQLKGRVAVLDCIYKNEGFLAINFRVKGRNEVVRTNRRHQAKVKFFIGRGGVGMPASLYTSLKNLPVASERSAYVEKRIASWEGYLRIEEKNADVADITAAFSNATVNENFTQVSLVCSGVKSKDWKAMIGFSAKIKGQPDDLGNVVDANPSQRTVKIELNRKYQALARRGTWLPKDAREVVFSNFAELSQVRRLRKGFKDLQDGLAANPNLERILFEERPLVQITNKRMELDFHQRLNEYQQEAVTGAMSAHDLYVIQGPPGTGKTTVISELCHQLVKAGMKTLVASQSNLAVDNALGRLLSDPAIRILRYGRTESIEEEGKRFIEENVALHWKEGTLAAVREQRYDRQQLTAKLAKDIEQCENEIETERAELTVIKEKIELKKTAEQEYEKVAEELEILLKQQAAQMEKLQRCAEKKEKLTATYDTQKAEIERLEVEIVHLFITKEREVEMGAVDERLASVKATLRYLETKSALTQAKVVLQQTKAEIEKSYEREQQVLLFCEEVEDLKKLSHLVQGLAELGIKPALQIRLDMNALQRLIYDIEKGMFSDAYLEWESVDGRLVKATETLMNLLKSHFYEVESIQAKSTDQYRTPIEMHAMIDRLGKFILSADTKRVLAAPPSTPEKTKLIQRIADNVAFLLGKRQEVQQHLQRIKADAIRQGAEKFTSIKGAVKAELKSLIPQLGRERDEQRALAEQHTAELTRLEMELQTLSGHADDDLSLDEAKDEITRLQHSLAEFADQKAALGQKERRLEQLRTECEETNAHLEPLLCEWDERKRLESEQAEVLANTQKRLSEWAAYIEGDPEEQYKEKLSEIAHMAEHLKSLKKEQERLPLVQAVQDEWESLLADASEYDLDEIRKLYVQHANVIGTTCVASARREFMEEYPTFDVVIIDEVSKATPPELLLPMLKGKKVVLVGDHHQLPPLVGRETMEEFVEEIDNEEERIELRKMLKESLFERLFRSLPKQNKTMLAIQYRMHEDIMETIAPFYKEGQEAGLRCGLPDSDGMRDHQLVSHSIGRQHHLLWFDMPNESAYFESQVKGGTSLYNEAELLKIKELLIEIETATARAKQEGRIGVDEKKSVGIISFYGEQVKRIDRLIDQEIMPQQLHCRTGSVDKFQGMEMDVIILSFVRNHEQPSGTIGFAEDYRRLNVALSRAKELLIIVGSANMFTKRPKKAETKAMYSRLVEQVKKQDGFRSYEAVGAREGE